MQDIEWLNWCYFKIVRNLESKDMAEENFRCSQLILDTLGENPRAVEAQSRMEKDLDNAGRGKSAIDDITKSLSEVHFASTIKLNVGGKIYKTTLDTLRKDPDSMLSAMFSGKFELRVDEDDGAYFIDRDAELFRYVNLHITSISRDDFKNPGQYKCTIAMRLCGNNNLGYFISFPLILSGLESKLVQLLYQLIAWLHSFCHWPGGGGEGWWGAVVMLHGEEKA